MFTIVGTTEATEKALVMLYSQLESEKARREFWLRRQCWQSAMRKEADHIGVSQSAASGEVA
jgi:hypothetical protein